MDEKKTDPTLSKYENPDSTIIQMLLAAKEGDVQFLKRYLTTYYCFYNIIIINWAILKTYNLYIASNIYNSSMLRLWFQEIDLNQFDYDGRTPLHLAACEGKYECVDFLINLAEVNPSPIDR